MTNDTYQLALGEGDEYAAIFASILNRIDAAFDYDAADDLDMDDGFEVEEPDF